MLCVALASLAEAVALAGEGLHLAAESLQEHRHEDVHALATQAVLRHLLEVDAQAGACLLYTSPSPRDLG